MRILLITFLLVVKVQYAALLKKCCDSDSYLKRINSTYICDKDKDKRLQIFTKHTNYLNENNETGEDYCFDGKQNIAKYKIRNHTVTEENPVDVNIFFPKCCPLNSYYHSVTHSCVWADNINDSFITQKFVRVGLPDCKVVVDYKLDPEKPYHRMESSTLQLDGSTRFHDGQFCMDMGEDDRLIARGCYEDYNVCNYSRCIHKCCPDGQSLINGKYCHYTYTHGLDLTLFDQINNTQDPFAIIHKYECKEMYMMLSKHIFYLDTDGVFWLYYNNTMSFERFEVNQASYCIDHIYRREDGLNGFKFFMCHPDKTLPIKFVITRWTKIISCIFIILTLAIYLFIPELLNPFGKILVSFCIAMLAAFILLTYTQFGLNISDTPCIVLSFLSIYTSLCCFSWLNAMCFDIWSTFGTPKSFVTDRQRRSELKRFFLYSLYGWGIPAGIILIIFWAYRSTSVPDAIRPVLGTYKCYFEYRTNNYALFLYYVLPLILMVLSNLVLFTKTMRYCLKVKGEINKMNENRISVKEKKKRFNADKEQLFLILKLGVTMGTSFSFEVVSALYVFSSNYVMEYIEIIWDTINSFQGVFIFIIFICKSKVFQLCRLKLLGPKAKKKSLSSPPTTAGTPLT